MLANKRGIKTEKHANFEVVGQPQNIFRGIIIDTYLNPFNVPYEMEYHVHCSNGKRYRIDLYLPTFNIAIEYDENGHKNYNYEQHEGRQIAIEKELGCSFIRVTDEYNITNAVGIVAQQLLPLITNKDVIEIPTKTIVKVEKEIVERVVEKVKVVEKETPKQNVKIDNAKKLKNAWKEWEIEKELEKMKENDRKKNFNKSSIAIYGKNFKLIGVCENASEFCEQYNLPKNEMPIINVDERIEFCGYILYGISNKHYMQYKNNKKINWY